MWPARQPHRARKPIEERKAERELLFWTARQTLRIAALAALTICLIVSVAVSLIEGQLPASELLLRLF